MYRSSGSSIPSGQLAEQVIDRRYLPVSSGCDVFFALLYLRHRFGIAENLNGIEEGVKIFPPDHSFLYLFDLKIEFIDGDSRSHE